MTAKKDRDAESKKRKLELTIASLQDRWGTRVIRPAAQPAAVPHVPTGFPLLDKSLGLGGLPRGRISEIIGVPTSGMATIALKTMANAQAKGGTAIYIDPNHTFDPDYAARCGLSLNQLLLARPYNTRQGLNILQDFILGGSMSVLIFDTPLELISDPGQGQALARTLDRIISPLGRSRCALLFLVSLPARAGLGPVADPAAGPAANAAANAGSEGYPAGAVLPFYATIRLFVRRERWIYHRRDIRGYQAQVLILKNKLGPAGKQIKIAITFNGTVAGPDGDADQGI